MGENVPLLNTSFFCGRFIKSSKVHNCICKGRTCLPSVPLFLWSHCGQCHTFSMSVSNCGQEKPKCYNKAHTLPNMSSILSLGPNDSCLLPSWTPHRTSAAGTWTKAGSSLLWVTHEPTAKDLESVWEPENKSVEFAAAQFFLNMSFGGSFIA